MYFFLSKDRLEILEKINVVSIIELLLDMIYVLINLCGILVKGFDSGFLNDVFDEFIVMW